MTIPPMHKAISKDEWFSQFGLRDLDWPAQSLDPSKIKRNINLGLVTQSVPNHVDE